MLKVRHIAFFCMAVFLFGCQSSGPRAVNNRLPAETRELTFDQNQAILKKLSSFQLEGRFTTTVKGEAQTANLSWLQESDHYLIKVSGPLQQGAVYLRGNAQGISYKDAKGTVDSAPNAEALLLKHTGYDLPISSLRYWIMGRPDPRYAFKLTVGNNGNMETITQSGWTISYSEFTYSAPYRVPTHIELTHPNASVSISIHQWNTDLTPR